MDTLSRLVAIILQNPGLDAEDRIVVKDVVYKSKLDLTSFEDVNDKIKGQVEIEAGIAYLLGKYRDQLTDLRYDLDEEESTAILEVPKKNEQGYKTSTRELKAYQSVNPEVAVKRRRVSAAESLYATFEALWKIVFARNDKLRELSINYRRDQESDK
jgi:hypothetical protein